MKHIVMIILAGALFVSIGCNTGNTGGVSSFVDPDSGKLTNAKAQRAIQQWMGKGTVTVQGVQEVSQENAAKADITFNDFRWNSKGNMLEAAGERRYSGPAVAVFSHYNDGRWVLTKVTTSQGFNSTWWDNINVEAR
jgi:hypothetical protein